MKTANEMAALGQRNQTIELQRQEGERANRRFAMDEQLLPGRLTAQQQANKAQSQTIEAVARKVTGEQAARAEFDQIHQDMVSGKLRDPDELDLRTGSALIKSGDSAKVEQWLSNREKLLRGGKVAEQLTGISSAYMEAAKNASENPNDPMVWSRAVVGMNQKYPLGAPTSEQYKAALKRSDAALEALPGPIGTALKEYRDLRAVMGPSQAWSKTLANVNPAFQADFNKHMPPDVKAEYEALGKGGIKKAESAAEAPFRLKEIEAKGAQDIALEAKKEEGRKARGEAPSKVILKELDNVTRDIGQLRTNLNQPLIGAEDKARWTADLEVAMRERGDIKTRLAASQVREEEGKSTTQSTLPTAEEAQFQTWYSGWAKKAGIDPNPDNPEHKYDYRAAFKAGAVPAISKEDGRYHWPSQFKADDHPNRFVGGKDTKGGTLDPKKVRAEKIGPITLMLRKQSKSFEDSKRALDHNLGRKAIGQAEYDQLLSSERLRWAGSK